MNPMASMLVPLWSHIRASFSFIDTCAHRSTLSRAAALCDSTHACLSADSGTQTKVLQIVLRAACLQSLGGDDAVDLAHFAHEVEGAPSKAIHDRVRVATGAAGQPILAALDCPGATGACAQQHAKLQMLMHSLPGSVST